MKRKHLFIILIGCLIINVILITTVLIPKYLEIKKDKDNEEKVNKAIVKVSLKDDVSISILEDVKVSDMIEDINGEIVDDYLIDTEDLGEKEVNFEYINEEGIKIPYSYKVNVVDDIKPVIWLGSSYTVYTDYNGKLLEDITCADNYDDNPKCEIIGDYNTKKVGKYKLTFKATDASNNVTTQEFTLNVKERPPKTNNSSSNSEPSYTYIEDVIKDYKTDTNKIGIDVSSWQGDIDFKKVKDAGIEFVFIRVGSTRGIEEEYFVDKTFKQNIEGFNSVGIPVGIYFYSYANSIKAARQDAEWVLEQIKGYKIDLPVAYDWESWSFYNEFHQSFYSLTKSAKAFLDTIANAGYEGTLYSSKRYLETVWYDTGYPIWLAHYTDHTSYQGEYKYWQMCSNGRVPGIKGNVDINIMY